MFSGASPACCNSMPRMLPSPAPRNNVGVITPPTAPDPTVMTVASSLARKMPINTFSAGGLCTMLLAMT